MTFTFNNAIPAAGNNPSSDQPDMLQNNISNALIWDVDHYGFGVANGGTHLRVRMPFNPPGAIPIGLIANEVTLYPKTASGNSNLFFTNGNSGSEYQLTRASLTNFPKFATNLAYGTPPGTFTQIGGWTFLPGGMLMQYGFYGKAGATGSSGTIQFPFTFTTGAFSITMVAYRPDTNSGSGVLVIDSGTPPSTTGFNFRASTSGNDGIYWTAIGV